MKSPTTEDVSRLAGVSVKTVSRVFNHEPHVREALRDRVREAARILGYKPNQSARSLASARSYAIAIFCEDPRAGFNIDVHLGAIDRCREDGYHVIVEKLNLSVASPARSLTDFLQGVRVDGVVLPPPLSDNPLLMEALEQSGTPYVRVAPFHDLQRAPCVVTDDRAAARMMTEYLLAQGHRDIAFIRGPAAHGAAAMRHAGYIDAMEAAHLPVRQDRILQGDFHFRSGFDASETLLAGDDPPTAVFASNDEMALGVMARAHRSQLHLPEQLSVAGFDDMPIACATWPQLTTVHQPIAEMSAAAIDCLIRGESAMWDDGKPPRIAFDCSIVVRGSTMPVSSKIA